MAKKKLPETLYVYEEQDGKETYFYAYRKKEDCAEWEVKQLVGEYQLKKTMIVETVAKSTDIN